jgi:phosphatidylserine/phosphatidylglycerophosphate/cardiolipin synthase-like enzyme
MKGLRGVATAELERLAEALRGGRVAAPVSVAAMDALGLRGVANRAEAFAGLDRQATLAVIENVLEERSAPRPTLDLVWSGPEGKTGWAAPTAKVLVDLFERAERSVLLAGYAFDHGATILEPLHEAMVRRKVTVDVFLHVATAPRATKDLDAYVENEVARFLSVQWSWPEKPRVYVDPRTAAPAGHGQYASMHAKCVVVDERWSLVGSANFTSRGQERNIEVGALIEDAGFARAVVSQFRSAIAAGVFRA